MSLNPTQTKEPFQIAFGKDEETAAFLISMFSYIGQAKSKISHIEKVKGGYQVIEKTNPEDIVNLNIDYSLLDDKIFNWFDNRASRQPLVLTHDETKTFVLLVHAAHWFATEQTRKTVHPNFFKYYEHIVKKAKENGL